ncbi:MAG: LL-diaminopimelate aminotransferase [Rikenellaceae bacterium]|jgi:LL-diaminopimelate aminotransferase|nr:LL-diaminopimelate aminotransferase [Rikenellaceae bacterium]
MIRINDNYVKLPESYLFSEIARRVATFRAANPTVDVISLGIGDVTRPLAPSVIDALHRAVDEQAAASTFRGYGPEQGYEFLRRTIIEHDFAPRGVQLSPDEVFISDGAKSDLGNFADILAADNVVALTDPVYPAYVDVNAMGGRAGRLTSEGWSGIIYLPCVAENSFIPQFPASRPDVIYLCYPNNPTGTTLDRRQLKQWVDYALENGSLILFDAAYEAFISRDEAPHSIYEIEGARRVAVEFRSFSKTAGFTGLRCGYTVVPKELKGYATAGEEVEVNKLWNRRQCTKFNGTAYIVQRAAEAIYSPQGRKEIRASVDYYLENARIIRENFLRMGMEVYGGVDAPYIWLRTPQGMGSWEFFDMMLDKYNVVVTPGVGFGPSGEGFVRLTAFGQRERIEEAMKRLVL